MIRMIISLPQEIKVWLDSHSKKMKKPSAEIVRLAIKHYREKIETKSGDPLRDTAGIWEERNIDALEYTRSLRDEWQDRNER